MPYSTNRLRCPGFCVSVCSLLCVFGRMMDIQKPATTIKIRANDPLYLSFLPALDTAMVAAWHQPKVEFTLIC